MGVPPWTQMDPLCPLITEASRPSVAASTQTWAQFGVGTVASSTGSLLFNIKKRAHNCIKTCIIIPEEGRAQPLVIAGLL